MLRTDQETGMDGRLVRTARLNQLFRPDLARQQAGQARKQAGACLVRKLQEQTGDAPLGLRNEFRWLVTNSVHVAGLL